MKKYAALAVATFAGTWISLPLLGEARTAQEICGSYFEFIQKDIHAQLRQNQNKAMNFCRYHYHREIRDLVYDFCLKNNSAAKCGCFDAKLQGVGLNTLTLHVLEYPSPPAHNRAVGWFERCEG